MSIMLKNKIIVICLLLCFSFAATAQSISELDKRNGFKDIKLNSPISQYGGLEFKKEIEDELYKEAKLYVAKKGFYESIGSIKVFDVEVKTFKDSIFQIIVVTQKNPNLYKGLKKAFGEPEYHLRKEFHHWTGENLRLSYVPYQKDKLELTYDSFLMREKLKEVKEEVIEDIISDF